MKIPASIRHAVLLSLCAAPLIEAATLAVTVEDVRSSEGMLMIQIVGSQAGFDGDEAPLAQLMLEPTTPDTSFEVELGPGMYGMRVMQDLDEDGEMDANFIGIPTEPWAFSNNAVGSFGPPKWEAVRFEITQEAAPQAVRLVH